MPFVEPSRRDEALREYFELGESAMSRGSKEALLLSGYLSYLIGKGLREAGVERAKELGLITESKDGTQ